MFFGDNLFFGYLLSDGPDLSELTFFFGDWRSDGADLLLNPVRADRSPVAAVLGDKLLGIKEIPRSICFVQCSTETIDNIHYRIFGPCIFGERVRIFRLNQYLPFITREPQQYYTVVPY